MPDVTLAINLSLPADASIYEYYMRTVEKEQRQTGPLKLIDAFKKRLASALVINLSSPSL